MEVPLLCNKTNMSICPSSPSHSRSSPPASAVAVFFFCKVEGHHPVDFSRGRNYECNQCKGANNRENWLYYCVSCAEQGMARRHFAAKHINSHINNKHERRNVKRLFAANSQHYPKILEYRRELIEKQRKIHGERFTPLPPLRSSPLEDEQEDHFLPSTHLQQIPRPVDFQQQYPLVNTESPKLPIAGRPSPSEVRIEVQSTSVASTKLLHHENQQTQALDVKETTYYSQQRQYWAKLINLGAMACLISVLMKKLLDAEGDKEQVAILHENFTIFLGHAMDVFPEKNYMNHLPSTVAEVLSSEGKITVEVFSEYKDVPNVILNDLMHQGSGNFLLLGFLLMGDCSACKSDPNIFLKGMFSIMGVSASSRTHEREKLFHVLSEWCFKYGVKLNEGVMDAIKAR